ncbi:hypothetical protein [Nocardia beijingensis]|uniref:DUF4254 domain-containing protein n=1 Tax=Nocardia beijingensis TaxID=95162 RepID=A0ABW7WDX4_9NOCA
MGAVPGRDASDGHPRDAYGHDTPEVPEWAPLEPLPSSQMLLAAFDGKRPVTAADILDPAFDLVACQEQYRLAFEMLGTDSVSTEQVKHAEVELVTAHADIEMLIAVIDDVVAERLRQWLTHLPSQKAHFPTIVCSGPLMPIHTESIGEVTARIAVLWEALSARGIQLDEGCADAEQLRELCRAYDVLAAEIETGRRLPPRV